MTAEGFDAGPGTIAWHLDQQGHRPPAASTIRRILHTAGLITPEPRNDPAVLTDVEILNWLYDHSRYLLGCTAHTPLTGDIVTTRFLSTAEEHGCPAATLTDNGRVYTARFDGRKNAFEYLLAVLGIQQKNGHPGHPQTQDKWNGSTRPSRSG